MICPGLPARPTVDVAGWLRARARAWPPENPIGHHADIEELAEEWERTRGVRGCPRCAAMLDKPDDRLYHAQDRTWWRWERDQLVAAEAPQPPAVGVPVWLRDLIRDLHASLPHDMGNESIDAHLADLRGRCVRALGYGSLADGATTPSEPTSRIWAYGCPEHPGNLNAMSNAPSTCLANPSAGTKGAQQRSQICGRKLEPLWIGDDERPSREVPGRCDQEAEDGP